MEEKKIFLFVGTTAELIKLVPVIREFNKRKKKFTIIASGQNDIQFTEYSSFIEKTQILKAVSPKGNKSSAMVFFIWTARTFFSLLKGMRGHFIGLNKGNSLFIVHGDTVSSLMGSLVAVVYGLTLVHIESGLRSFNFFEPFPEEICRFIISKLADVHFCPNSWTMRNIVSTKGRKINTRQNTLIETFWYVMKKKSNYGFIRQIQKKERPYFVLVIHRQEHVLFNKKKTQDMIKYILHVVPSNIQCLFLIHDISTNFVYSLRNIIPKEVEKDIVKVKRLPYRDFIHLIKKSEFFITDGGSNQEEAYYMGKPCLLLRKCTERIEGLGGNVLLSKNNKITINRFIKNYTTYRRLPVKIDIRPSEIIADYLFSYER